MAKASDTRRAILEKAFELIYTKGYQTTSVDDIISNTNVTKGAFYYHFETKDDMGLAIINEIVKPTMQEAFIQPLLNARDPLKEIFHMIKDLLFNNPYLKIEHGCPAGNLTQEMAPWNQQFSQALSEIMLEWQKTIEVSIKKAKSEGSIKRTINPAQVSCFIMSGYWGIRSFGKLYNSDECYYTYLKELKRYLNDLK